MQLLQWPTLISFLKNTECPLTGVCLLDLEKTGKEDLERLSLPVLSLPLERSSLPPSILDIWIHRRILDLKCTKQNLVPFSNIFK